MTLRSRLIGIIFLVGNAALVAQQTANVTINATKVLNPLTRESVGVYTQVGDENLLTPATVNLLRIGGFTSIAYPAGWESAANAYHWATNSLTPHPGNADAPQKPYLVPGNDVGHLVLALDKTGITPIIQVNYGSNLHGDGGGDPMEAAAWVAFANGDPANTQPIGKDWKTVGFWAGLRAATPLPTDDGYNFLRVHHPDPLHIQLWQVGDDIAENGYYGGDHKGTLDLHAPYPAAPKDNDKRRKLKELSPAFYGERVAEFAVAMKAVDPKIQIGAGLTMPTGDTWAPDWNQEVLKSACKDIDFVSFHWNPGNALPPDWKTLDETSVLYAPQEDFPKIIAEMLYQDHRYCPTGRIPRVVLSQFSPISWATVNNQVVPALFAADAYATFAEAGIANSSWYQLRENGITNKDGKPNPAYFGTQMFHIMAFRPGDAILATTGASANLSVHAAHRQDGPYTLMLINKDPQVKLQVKVAMTGANLATGNGIRFVYGPNQVTKGTGPERSDLKIDGNTLVLDVPAYSIVDVIMPAKP